MTLLRLAMHRAGVIDKMVPQVVEEWISDRLNADPRAGKWDIIRSINCSTSHTARDGAQWPGRF
jgi:hypothetical protein